VQIDALKAIIERIRRDIRPLPRSTRRALLVGLPFPRAHAVATDWALAAEEHGDHARSHMCRVVRRLVNTSECGWRRRNKEGTLSVHTHTKMPKHNTRTHNNSIRPQTNERAV
jgi:hypothetical protein